LPECRVAGLQEANFLTRRFDFWGAGQIHKATSIMPLAKTKSCEAPHFQYHVSGRVMVLMDDGTQLECRPGDVSLLPVGHDAYVVGEEPAVVVDFQGMVDYAK